MSSDRSRNREPGAGQQRWFLPAIALLFVVFGLELFLSVRQESETFDEPAHLYAGYGYWLRSDFGVNPEHPPLVKLVAALPLLVDRPTYPEPMNVYFRGVSLIGGRQLLGGSRGWALLSHARLALSLFAFACALLVVLAAREMFGEMTALLALALFVFEPNILAHGALIGTDMGVTCCVFATVYAFYRYVKRPSLLRLGICGTAAGLALAAKHSAILVLPLLALLSAAEVVRREPAELPGSTGREPNRVRLALRLGGAFVAITAIAVTVLWACYGFRYQARPGTLQIIPSMSAYVSQLHYPVERAIIGFAVRHHLLPEAYLFGFTDITMLSREGRVMYLFGKVYPQGRWFYFPAAFAIKSTIGLLGLLLLVPFARDLWRRGAAREGLFLLLSAAVFFGAAMTSKLDIGIRHILPAIPFLIVLAAASAISLAQRSRGWAWAVSVLLALQAVSSLRAFPDYLPYSNEAFGSPERTYRVLADSNVGWGGGLKTLHAYIDRQHITECWLAYTAPPDPAKYGIPCKPLPSWMTMVMGTAQEPAVPEQIRGPVFITSQEIAGVFWGPDDLNPYQPFLHREPSHVVAGEMLEFDGNFAVTRVAALSQVALTFASLQRGKSDDSLAHAQRAAALDPQSLYVHEGLAFSYAARRQPELAMQEYRTAMHIYQTVHPEFATIEFPPQNPLAPPGQ